MSWLGIHTEDSTCIGTTFHEMAVDIGDKTGDVYEFNNFL